MLSFEHENASAARMHLCGGFETKIFPRRDTPASRVRTEQSLGDCFGRSIDRMSWSMKLSSVASSDDDAGATIRSLKPEGRRCGRNRSRAAAFLDRSALAGSVSCREPASPASRFPASRRPGFAAGRLASWRHAGPAPAACRVRTRSRDRPSGPSGFWNRVFVSSRSVPRNDQAFQFVLEGR